MKPYESLSNPQTDAAPTWAYPSCHPGTNAISIECYEKNVPAFVESELDRIYEALASSLPHLKMSGAVTADTSTYVARNGECVRAVLLFVKTSGCVRVLNRRMVVSEAELSRFCDYIFNRYSSVHTIIFPEVHTSVDREKYVTMSAGSPADFVVNLPDTPEKYRASLSPNTRNNVKRYPTRTLRDFPSFRIDFYNGDAADEKDILEIIRLNKMRTLEKNEVYYRSTAETEKILELVKKYGVVGVARINGVVCGGTISYRIGDTFIGAIMSHDSKYNYYAIGATCVYQSICEAITQGARQYNFMTGNNEYKRMLGGQMRHYQQLAIFRSRLHLLINAPTALAMRVHDANYRFTFYCQETLYELQRRSRNDDLDFRSGLLFRTLSALREFKHLLSRVSVSLRTK